MSFSASAHFAEPPVLPVKMEPRVKWIVRILNASNRRSNNVSLAAKRLVAARAARSLGWLAMSPGPSSVTSTDRLVPVRDGRIAVRLYRPSQSGEVSQTGSLPLHVFFHGGGWCSGSIDERDPRCRVIAAGAACVVASVSYRLAPENTYPTAPEDCYAALCWLVKHASELQIDPDRVSVGGESAGGNLAAVVCLMARDRSGPVLRYQWLDVPATDLTLSQPSMRSTPSGYLLDYDSMVVSRDRYLPDPERQALEAYASPLHADDLSGLPPAMILTCGCDPLRDEGRAYATRLTAAGVEVQHVHLEGHVHLSFAFTRLLPSARSYERLAVGALAEALDGPAAL
jgi:acetyl esterase